MESRCMPRGCADGALIRPGAQQRPALIVFDLDGTIVDSRELARECYKRVFALLGCGQITDEQADAFNGPSADEICRAMGVEGERRALYDRLLEEMEGELVRTVGKIFPGVPQMLQALAPHACLAILTNGSGSYCEENIRAFALGPYISLHSGFVSGVSKAQRIAMWARETGARLVICVGDRGSDVANARAAGAVAVAVAYGMGNREELSGADYLCDTPAEVARVCRRLIAL